MKKHSKRKKNRILIIASGILVLVITGWLIGSTAISHSTYVVQIGTFEKYIETKGEIQGKEALNITLGEIFKDRELEIHDVRIRDMVPEGTIVKKGDWVATLDQNTLNQRIQRNLEEMERSLANFKDAIIDSTVYLTQLRQRIVELEYDLQYNELELEASKYESPAYQRRVQTAYNQKVRQIEKSKRDYELRRKDMITRTKRDEDRYNYYLRMEKKLNGALVASTVTAPQAGMVIYARNRFNRKIRAGEEVSMWRPVIATLPDLSVLVSETFVEEIDIAKISVGDSAIIKVDAVPGQQFSGTIISIANIGQEVAGFDNKAFAVTIQINQSDKRLLPGMTSSNQIIIEKTPGQLIIPRNCLFSENGTKFVYLKKSGKIWKKEVAVGPENDEVVVILNGLEERDRIVTQLPDDAGKIAYLPE